MPPSKPPKTSKDIFLWGTASSAHQVEGNQRNNWSVWEASVADQLAQGAKKRLKNEVPNWPAIAKEATNPANYISGTAANHYSRYKEDFDILKQLNCNAYRFSIEWSRIEPEPGQYSQSAMDHYLKMIAELKKRQITPLVTLHHFSDPVWLEDLGGWHGKEGLKHFLSYAEFVAKNAGQDVEYWCTINEPGSYLLMRYLGGGAWQLWPKTVMNPWQGYQYLRNVIKAQKQVRLSLKRVNPKAKVGLSHMIIDFQLGRREPLSYLFKKALSYIPDTYLINRLKNDVDYIGIDYYLRMASKVSFKNPNDWAIRWNGSEPRNDMGWGVYPEGLYNVTQRLKHYSLPLLILENGIPDEADDQRATFIKNHIEAVDRSIADGADIRGYFYWSLLDNYEWSEGSWPKFGLVAVDRQTQARTVRQSAYEYAKIIKQHQV